jgi:hypothetical protein
VAEGQAATLAAFIPLLTQMAASQAAIARAAEETAKAHREMAAAQAMSARAAVATARSTAEIAALLKLSVATQKENVNKK